jgi:hypothetical protein
VIFSVYDYDKGRYRYYEGVGGSPATGFFRKARQPALNGGFVPESFAVALPAGSRLVGEGAMPKGYIAEDPAQLAAPPVPGEGAGAGAGASAEAGASTHTSWKTLAFIALAAFLAGRLSKRSAP